MTKGTITHAAFAAHQLPDHAGINGKRWFLGAPYLDQTGAQKTVPRTGGSVGVFWVLTGGILDAYEIAQGSGNRYRTVDLYDAESEARAALAKALETAVRALRKHERSCVVCSNAGLQEECETRRPLAYRAAEFLTGIRP